MKNVVRPDNVTVDMNDGRVETIEAFDAKSAVVFPVCRLVGGDARGFRKSKVCGKGEERVEQAR